jgi:hypothetical protein
MCRQTWYTSDVVRMRLIFCTLLLSSFVTIFARLLQIYWTIYNYQCIAISIFIIISYSLDVFKYNFLRKEILGAKTSTKIYPKSINFWYVIVFVLCNHIVNLLLYSFYSPFRTFTLPILSAYFRLRCLQFLFALCKRIRIHSDVFMLNDYTTGFVRFTRWHYYGI